MIAGANVGDDKLLAATLDAIVVKRPDPIDEEAPDEEAPQHLCLEKDYDNEPSREIVRERGYVAHIRHIGEEKKGEAGEKRYPARRWVVERTNSWTNAHNKLLWCTERKGGESSTSGLPFPTRSVSWEGSSEKPGVATVGQVDLLTVRNLLTRALKYRYNEFRLRTVG